MRQFVNPLLAIAKNTVVKGPIGTNGNGKGLGLFSPVFTAFKNDGTRSVNFAGIDAYGQWLKQKGLNGVLVNGTTGEGITMTVAERQQTAEQWLRVSKANALWCMVQIGGTNLHDIYRLAEHAEQTKTDAVLCLPDLFFKPASEEALVHYLKGIAERCPTRPLFYYHFPRMTGVSLYMPRFCELAEKEIETFRGIKYTNGDMEEGVACLAPGRTVFLGGNTILTGALALGFDSAILTTLNVFPEYAVSIFENMRNNQWQEARAVQDKWNAHINQICPRGADWVQSMKEEFDRVNPKFPCGPCRKPLTNVSKK